MYTEQGGLETLVCLQVSKDSASWSKVDKSVQRAEADQYATLVKQTEKRCVPLSSSDSDSFEVVPPSNSNNNPSNPAKPAPVVLKPDKNPDKDNQYLGYVKFTPDDLVEGSGGGRRRSMIEEPADEATPLMRGHAMSGQWAVHGTVGMPDRSVPPAYRRSSGRRASHMQVEIVSTARHNSLDLAHFLSATRRKQASYIIYTTDPSKRLDCQTSDVLGEEGIMLLKSAVIRVARCQDGVMSAESQVVATVRPGKFKRAGQGVCVRKSVHICVCLIFVLATTL
jgi:hypothetical protein